MRLIYALVTLFALLVFQVYEARAQVPEGTNCYDLVPLYGSQDAFICIVSDANEENNLPVPENMDCYPMQPFGSLRIDFFCVVKIAQIPPTATATATVPPSVPAPTTAPTATPLPDPNVRIVPDQYPTIASALSGIAQGSTVLLRSGTYREQVTLRTAGVTLTTAPGATAWIDGECSRPNGVYVGANDVSIKNLGVKRTTEAGVIVAEGKARLTVHGNIIQDFNCLDAGDQHAAGVAAWYAGPGHVVTDNTIIRRQEVTGSLPGKGNGIWFKSNTTDFPSGGGHTITGNTIRGGYDGIGGETEGDPRGGFDRNTIIGNNHVSDCADDGIQVEGGGLNIIVQNNTIIDCGVGFAMATPLTGPLTFRHNTVTITKPGLAYGMMSCYKVGRSSTVTISILDSVCTAQNWSTPNAGKGIQQTNAGIGTLIVERNVWNVTAYAYEITSTLGSGSRFNSNCFVTNDPTRFVKWATGQYTTLSAFQATGNELQGRMGPC